MVLLQPNQKVLIRDDADKNLEYQGVVIRVGDRIQVRNLDLSGTVDFNPTPVDGKYYAVDRGWEGVYVIPKP